MEFLLCKGRAAQPDRGYNLQWEGVYPLDSGPGCIKEYLFVVQCPASGSGQAAAERRILGGALRIDNSYTRIHPSLAKGANVLKWET